MEEFSIFKIFFLSHINKHKLVDASVQSRFSFQRIVINKVNKS